MEYLDGRDLHAVLEMDGPLSVDATVDYVLQACDAIAAAHALGIIHRDLKPGNLFLTKRADGSPLVKVLDFGISKITGSDSAASSGLTTTTTIMGTPAFMPPEQLRSTRHVDTRADIWSLGTILFALLTGEPPYSGESTADIAAKIIRDPPPPLRTLRPDAPEGLEAVVLRCLEKEPDGRYAGIAELAEALLPFAPEGARASALRLTRANFVAPARPRRDDALDELPSCRAPTVHGRRDAHRERLGRASSPPPKERAAPSSPSPATTAFAAILAAAARDRRPP